ncbi:MAG: OmpA family protein [Bacteroidota bacterium]
MKHFSFLLFGLFLLAGTSTIAQQVPLKGFVYAADNSGYLNEVKITVLDDQKSLIGKAVSNMEGQFEMMVPQDRLLTFKASKSAFEDHEVTIRSESPGASGEVYVQIPLTRAPGYIFEVTLAEYRAPDSEDPVDAIDGATIEVYNKTTRTEELVLKNHKGHIFNVSFEPGNSYEMMVRKKGFFTKRMEINVAVDGCILCMDGFGSIRPGVQDNLTSGHDAGTLASDISLKRVDLNETIEINNIFYDLGKWDIRSEAAIELDNLVGLLSINPDFVVELSSHTDARGSNPSNLTLSQKRAESAVNYLVGQGIERSRLVAKGYGETKLKNKCKDGITCSEELHQENRRTELQVIGYTTDTTFLNRSFKDIIEEEMLMEEIMQLDQTVIQIPEGGLDTTKVDVEEVKPTAPATGVSDRTNLLNSLLGDEEESVPVPVDTTDTSSSGVGFDASIEAMAQLDTEIVERDPVLPAASGASPIGTDAEEYIAMIEEETAQKANRIEAEPAMGAMSGDLPAPKKPQEELASAAPSRSLGANEPASDESQILISEVQSVEAAPSSASGSAISTDAIPIAEVEIPTEKPSNSATGVGGSNVPETPEPVEEIVEVALPTVGGAGVVSPPTSAMEEVEEVAEVMIENPIPDHQQLSPDFSGYKIQLLSTSMLLGADHSIFREFGQIKILESPKAYHYLMGEFKSLDSAQSFLDSTLANRFPNAQVVTIENGEMK